MIFKYTKDGAGNRVVEIVHSDSYSEHRYICDFPWHPLTLCNWEKYFAPFRGDVQQTARVFMEIKNISYPEFEKVTYWEEHRLSRDHVPACTECLEWTRTFEQQRADDLVYEPAWPKEAEGMVWQWDDGVMSAEERLEYCEEQLGWIDSDLVWDERDKAEVLAEEEWARLCGDVEALDGARKYMTEGAQSNHPWVEYYKERQALGEMWWEIYLEGEARDAEPNRYYYDDIL